MQPAIRAAIEPTDRSMPPEIITNVMPTAMMPIKAVRVSTFIILSMVAKSPLSKVPAMHRASKPSTGPKPLMRAPSLTRDVTVVSVRAGCMGNQLLFSQVLGAERGLQTACAHHRDAVAQADQFNQFGRNHDHGAPFGGQSVDQEINVALGAHVHATAGFIEHDDSGIGMQVFRQRQLLLVATRQHACAALQVARADIEI